MIIAPSERGDVLIETLRSVRGREFNPADAVMIGDNDEGLPRNSSFPDVWQFVRSMQKVSRLLRKRSASTNESRVVLLEFAKNQIFEE